MADIYCMNKTVSQPSTVNNTLNLTNILIERLDLWDEQETESKNPLFTNPPGNGISRSSQGGCPMKLSDVVGEHCFIPSALCQIDQAKLYERQNSDGILS